MSSEEPRFKFDGFADAKAELIPQFWVSTLDDEQRSAFEELTERFGFVDGAIRVTPSIVAGCDQGHTELTFGELTERIERFDRGEPQ